MPEHAQIEDLPDPTAELVLLRVLVEAHVATMPRKKGERFLRLVADKLANEAQLAEVLSIRPSRRHSAGCEAQRTAAKLYRWWTPVFLARLPPE